MALRPQAEDEELSGSRPVVTPCAGCHNPAEAAAWGSQLCYPCLAAWDLESPTDDERVRKYPDDTQRFAAITDWTKRWAEKRKAKARAA